MDLPNEVGDGDRWASTLAEINDCPYYRLLGMKALAMGDGYARLALPADEKLFQIYGSLHGGAIASLADSAVACALISTCTTEERALTVDLKLNFLAPVSHGVLIAEGRLLQRGRRIAAGEVEIRDGDGRLVAKGICTLVPAKG